MTGETLHVRAMALNDVPRVHEIECVCFRSPWSINALRGELRNDAAHYKVLESDGEIVGYAGMWVLFDEAHITNVAVMPEYRGRGLGEGLMLAMMGEAVQKGATSMTLEVREGNQAAQKLYARLGFHQNGYRPRYYDDTGEGALLLWNRDIRRTIAEKTLHSAE